MRSGSRAASRSSLVASTLPGSATPVTRLARLTGGPYQSPSRLRARPGGEPRADRRRIRRSASTRSVRARRSRPARLGAGPTNMTASPIVFTILPGAGALRRAAREPPEQPSQLRDVDPLAEPGEPDHVREADDTPGARPARPAPPQLQPAVLLVSDLVAEVETSVWSMSGEISGRSSMAAEVFRTRDLALVHALFEQGPCDDHPHRLRDLGQAPSQHARDLQHALLRHAGRADACKRVRRLEVLSSKRARRDRAARRRSPGASRAGSRAGPRQLRDLARRVASARPRARARPGSRPSRPSPAARHVRGREAVGVEPAQELEPRLALAPLEPVEQPGPLEVSTWSAFRSRRYSITSQFEPSSPASIIRAMTGGSQFRRDISGESEFGSLDR